MHSEAATTVVVTSLNRSKIAAVNKVASLFLDGPINVVGVKSESLVAETPVGDHEAICGCYNRITAAKAAHPAASYFVSIEGAIDLNQFGAFVYSWVLVEERFRKREALGCSAKVQLPPALLPFLDKSVALSALWQELRGCEQNVAELGTNGVITQGRFCREDEFQTALLCAFGFLHNESNYLPIDISRKRKYSLR